MQCLSKAELLSCGVWASVRSACADPRAPFVQWLKLFFQLHQGGSSFSLHPIVLTHVLLFLFSCRSKIYKIWSQRCFRVCKCNINVTPVPLLSLLFSLYLQFVALFARRCPSLSGLVQTFPSHLNEIFASGQCFLATQDSKQCPGLWARRTRTRTGSTCDHRGLIHNLCLWVKLRCLANLNGSILSKKKRIYRSGGGFADVEGETVGVVSQGLRQSICIKGRAACPMVEKVGITPFRLAEREDWRERQRGAGGYSQQCIPCSERGGPSLLAGEQAKSLV